MWLKPSVCCWANEHEMPVIWRQSSLQISKGGTTGCSYNTSNLIKHVKHKTQHKYFTASSRAANYAETGSLLVRWKECSQTMQDNMSENNSTLFFLISHYRSLTMKDPGMMKTKTHFTHNCTLSTVTLLSLLDLVESQVTDKRECTIFLM